MKVQTWIRSFDSLVEALLEQFEIKEHSIPNKENRYLSPNFKKCKQIELEAGLSLIWFVKFLRVESSRA